METNEYKNLEDIPFLEKFLGEMWFFECYSKADGMQSYWFTDKFGREYTIDIISDEDCFFRETPFEDIYTQSGIKYFSLNKITDDIVSDRITVRWQYRPLVPESKKNYD